jgi:hypothetical protein
VAGMNIFTSVRCGRDEYLAVITVAGLNIFTSAHSGRDEYFYQCSLWQG